MTPPENLCPACGSKLWTSIGNSDYQIRAECQNIKCKTIGMDSGRGNTTKEAIADFRNKARKVRTK